MDKSDEKTGTSGSVNEATTERFLARYGQGELIRVDSLREIEAVLQAYPPQGGSWSVRSERRSSRDEGRRLLIEAATPSGAVREFAFDTASFLLTGGVQRLGDGLTDALDRLMERATAFAAENPPHHPGSLARFPIPSRRYSGRVEVPLAILAVDDDHRPGLYAPPRVVTLALADAEPHGVGEFPGFDPESWPPPRLGDWPPYAVRQLDQPVLAGMIGRLSAIWFRLMEAWVKEANEYAQRSREAAEALDLLAVLDLPEMLPYYRRLNPPFWRWLETSAAELAAA